MNVEYLAIAKLFLPEIVLTVGALLLLGIDLCLGKRDTRRALVLLGAVISLAAACVALLQWDWRPAEAQYVRQAAVTSAVQRMAPAVGRDALTHAARISERDARAVTTAYKAARHDSLVESAATPPADGAPVMGIAPYDAGLSSPSFSAWWLFTADNFALIFKAIFALALALALLLSTRFPVARYRGEFAALLMFAAVGLMVMVGSLDLVGIFLGLELASLCCYALAAWHKQDARSAEAGTKYLLLGSLASAIFIYGASLFFVEYGSTHLHVLAHGAAQSPLTLVALLMVLVSFLFKVAGAPFHLWAPDVYQGAPTAMVAFLSTAGKAAGFAVLVRVLSAHGFQAFSEKWLLLFIGVAALSILIGNLVAIHQNNVKRLLAYSGVAQAGYVLIGLVAMADPAGGTLLNEALPLTAFIFYLAAYMVMNIGAFAVVGIVGRESGGEELSAFAGLRARAPVLAFAFTLLLLSLGGIPLLSGFVGKWYLFLAGVYQGQYLLVLIGTTMSVVSMYYYLLVIKQMYILPAADGAQPIRVGALAAAGLAAITLVTVAIGIYPGPLYTLAQAAAKSLMP
ncbi:MAG TPA: NADH-quinone oxidoreductase subunit N [Armatimonadota bacterium]|nr:NADH-quinone oxidoreductase subunit N [Armatimonadota bacterium]